jgi:glycine betaine catabolism B
VTDLATAPGTRRDPERWLVPSQASTWENAQVVAVDRQTSATTLRLRLPTAPEQLLPGQYYLVRLAISRPPFSVQQAYSLSSSPYPASEEVEIAVRPVAGGRASPLLAHEVEAGDFLQVHGPYGFLTWTERDGGPLVLVGGGSGVVPLVSIVRYAAERRLEVPVTVLCSSRDRASALLRQPLGELAGRHRWLGVVRTFTRSPRDPHARYHRRIDVPMLAELLAQAGDLAGASFYVAGPGDMVLAVRAGLGELRIAQSSIFSEDHA